MVGSGKSIQAPNSDVTRKRRLEKQVPISDVTWKRQSASSDADVAFKSRKIGFLSVKFFDPDLLDCPVCFEPFTVPIFQCENGHIVCSSCCQRIEEKCPSCEMPVGFIRCRAIEKVLQSIKLFCPNRIHGCLENSLSYGKSIIEHEKTCAHTPCSCPIPGCERFTSPHYLYFHCSSHHKDWLTQFQYDHTFTIALAIDDKLHVLQGKERGLFILMNRAETIGNFITVSRIGSSSLKGGHSYDLAVKIDGTSHTFRSLTKNIQCSVDSNNGFPAAGLFIGPHGFSGDNRKISLDISISSLVSCPADSK